MRLNKTFLITGATDGIGRQTALELARLGARVIVHGRSPEQAAAARDAIRRAAQTDRVEAAAADLSSLDQVRELADDVSRRFDQLNGLINNAGVFLNERRESADGYELTWAVNHLAHFLLTNLLLEPLLAGAPSRVITVSSAAHARGRIDFDDLNFERSFNGYGAYAASKLANVLFAFALAERWQADGITSNALHPGVIATKLLAAGFKSTGGSLSEGAATSVYLASSPEVETITGEYFDHKRVAAPSAAARDRDLQRRLWEVSARQVGLAA